MKDKIEYFPGEIVIWLGYTYILQFLSPNFACLALSIAGFNGPVTLSKSIVPIKELQKWDGTKVVRENKAV